MATVNDVLKIAANEIGYSRWSDPLNGSKYGRWFASYTGNSYYGQNGIPYCSMFVSWVFNQAGQSCPGLPTASCSIIRANNVNTSRHISNKYDAQPGDLVLFNWDYDGNYAGAADHVGIVELNRGSYIQTIEGNTSSTSAGSQGNGGVVARRTRDCSMVCMIVRPAYSTKKDLSASDVNDIPKQVYTGSEIAPPVTSSTGATFDVSYRDNVNIGYGTAIATGTGNYRGTVEKAFAILPSELIQYDDVDPTGWYVKSLADAVALGYIKGYAENAIGPNDPVTRGQVCCMIANVEDVDLGTEYSDVVASPYYYDAVKWATEQGIVSGHDGVFRPDDPCTREEFCMMLCNWKGAPIDLEYPEYTDWNDISDWAKSAVAWCVADGIVTGHDGLIRPHDVCTRAEAATMIVNMTEKGE